MTLDLLRFIRQRSAETPLAIMSYYNPLRQRGDAWPDLSEEDAKRLDEAYRSGEF